MVIRHKMLGGCWVPRAGKKMEYRLGLGTRSKLYSSHHGPKKPSSSLGPPGRVLASDTVIMGIGFESHSKIKHQVWVKDLTTLRPDLKSRYALSFKLLIKGLKMFVKACG